MKIRTLFIVTLAIFAIILIIVAASVIVTNRLVGQISYQQELILQIRQDSNDMSYIVNEYLLYQEEQQLTLWESRLASVSASIAEIQPGNASQQVILRDVQFSLERWNNTFNDIASLTGDIGIEPDLLQVFWSRMEVHHRAIISSTYQYSQMLTDDINRLEQANLYLVISLFGIFGLYLALNYLLVNRRILFGLARLEKGTRIVSSGNLDFTIPEKKMMRLEVYLELSIGSQRL